ncbi:MAG: outer membrane lipoprotein-sorting protein [Polyangiaceae bacterium]|nr:outer membrane lipoprotein-sorting protein [Polyangiaceae bacterium]
MKGLVLRLLPAGASALAFMAMTSQASADAAGDKVLASVDAALNRWKTQYIKYDVTNQEPGKAERKLELEVKLKGEKRLTEFLAPADMKGTKVLILSSTQMYVYLPAFGKVRRIASSVTDQGFMGLTFTQTDLSLTRYTGMYTAQIASESGDSWKLVATPKAGQEVPYAKIEMTIAKQNTLPTELRYFNASGTHMKTENRSGYTCEGNVCTPSEMKMVDHTKGGHWTRLMRTAWKVNESIADEVFSKRSLEK